MSMPIVKQRSLIEALQEAGREVTELRTTITTLRQQLAERDAEIERLSSNRLAANWKPFLHDDTLGG